jgi:hypothetical protein
MRVFIISLYISILIIFTNSIFAWSGDQASLLQRRGWNV